VEEGKERDQGEGEGGAGGADDEWDWGGDWAPEIPVSSLSLVQCGAAITGAMKEGSGIAESTARSGIAGREAASRNQWRGAGSQRGAERGDDRMREGRGETKFLSHQNDIFSLVFLVVRDNNGMT